MSDLARLILARGQQQADWQREKYDRLGNAVANLGSTIGGAIEQKRKQQEIAARDQAIFDLMANPQATAKDFVRVAGPELGEKFWKASDAFKALQAEPTPEMAMKTLPYQLDGFRHLAPGGRAAAYRPLKDLLVKAQVVPQAGLPDDYDSAQIDPIIEDALKRMGGAPKTREVKTRNPDGSETVQIVEDKPGQTFQSASSPLTLKEQYAKAYAAGDQAGMDDALRAIGREEAAGRAPKEPEKPTYTMVNGLPYLAQADGTLKPVTMTGGGEFSKKNGEDAVGKDEARAVSIVTQMKRMKGLSEKIITTSGLTQKLKSAGRGIAAAAGHDADFQVYNDLRGSLAASIAVAVQGSRPSDADVFRAALPLIPDPYKDTNESAKQKWDSILDMFENQLSDEAKAKIGFDELKSETDGGWEERPGGIKIRLKPGQ